MLGEVAARLLPWSGTLLKAAGLVNVSLSIFLCQHNGDDALGDGGISGVR
jgi:hypothetical protein